ncbi:MAG: hypothetical protein Q8R40_06885 [bacterium]|nr:hypothetical protein [bacterium]
MPKTGIVVAIAVLVVGFMVSGASAFEPKFTLSSRLWSQYVGANGFVLHNGPEMQNDLSVGLPHGFTLGLTHFVGLNGSSLSSGFDDEVDLNLDWTGKLFGLNLNTGVFYLDLYPVLKGSTNMWQTYMEVGKEFGVFGNQTLTPYARLDVYAPAHAGSFEGGTWLRAGLKHHVPISDLVSLDHKVSLMHDDGALGFQPGYLADYQGSLSWAVTKALTVEAPNYRVVMPLENFSDGRGTTGVVGAGVVYRF